MYFIEFSLSFNNSIKLAIASSLSFDNIDLECSLVYLLILLICVAMT